MLRKGFSGAESVKTNYSQAFQDIFTLSVLNGKRNGCYVEIGGWHGTSDSNTYLLETLFDWIGFAVEWNPEYVERYNVVRKNRCLCLNALTIDYEEIFQEMRFPSQIDYLQVDISPAKNTLEALKRQPFEKRRYSVITFETDAYMYGKGPKEEAKSLLLSLGYELLAEDVKILGNPFEDWYVDPEVVGWEAVHNLRSHGLECSDCVVDSAMSQESKKTCASMAVGTNKQISFVDDGWEEMP